MTDLKCIVRNLLLFRNQLLLCLVVVSCNWNKSDLKTNDTYHYSSTVLDTFLNEIYSFNYEYYFVNDTIYLKNVEILGKGCDHLILLGVVNETIQTDVIGGRGNLCDDYYFSMYHSDTKQYSGSIKCELTTIDLMSHSFPDSVLPIQTRIIEFDENKNIKKIQQISKSNLAKDIGFGW